MPAYTDRQGLPLGADHFVLLKAPAYSLNEIVERPALALGFPHDELRRVQFHHVELQPLATRRELHGQAFSRGNKSEMLRQCQHCLAALKLAAATQVRPRFASLQRDIHDFPLGVGRMRLHKGFVARYREVALHLDIALKISSQAALAHAVDAGAAVADSAHGGTAVAGSSDAGAAGALADDAGAAGAVADDAVAAIALAEDADAAIALAEDADSTVADAMHAEAAITPGIHAVGPVGARGCDCWRPHHAAGKGSGPLWGHTHWLLLSLNVPSREVGIACSNGCVRESELMSKSG
jgi:hypothetical protein